MGFIYLIEAQAYIKSAQKNKKQRKNEYTNRTTKRTNNL